MLEAGEQGHQDAPLKGLHSAHLPAVPRDDAGEATRAGQWDRDSAMHGVPGDPSRS